MSLRLGVVPRNVRLILLVCCLAAIAVIGSMVILASGTFIDALDGPERSLSPMAGTIGQSFVARHAGLRTVSLNLSNEDTTSGGWLTLHIRSSAAATSDLRASRKSVTAPLPPGWYEFEFDPIWNSHNQYYFAYVDYESASSSQLRVISLPVDAYADGAMYLNGAAQQAQAAIRLGFDRVAIVVDLAQWLAAACAQLIALGIVLIVPGLALQTYLLPLSSWRARLAMAACMTLCLYPLLLIWLRVAGLHLGAVLVWSTIGLSGLALIKRAPRMIDWHALIRYLTLPRLVWACLVLVLVGSRWFVLRQIDAPMLGDSVQHTMIAQLLLDNGGLFSSWEPYVPYDSMTTHFGFHAAVAAVSWVTGAPVLDATLYVGQFMNVLAVVVLSLLAGWVIRSEWAGAGSLLLAGLLSQTPNVYVNWGRYPQLAGQVVAVAAIWWLLRIASESGEQPIAHGRSRLGNVLVSAVLLGGTAITYYRMPYYVAIIVLGILAVNGVQAYYSRAKRPQIISRLADILAGGVAGLALILPWLGNLRDGALVAGVESSVARGGVLEQVAAEYQGFQALNTYLPVWMVGLAILSFAIAVLRRNGRLVAIAIWGLAVCLLPASRLLRLPGASQLQVFAIIISLYMPVSVVAGYGLDALLAQLHASMGADRVRFATLLAALAIVVVSAVVGTTARLRVYEPRDRILAPADLRAMDYIRRNVDPHAKILVNGFLVYEGRSAVGSDGGWYIPLLTQRQSTMPPQYALLAEHPSDPQYNRQVVDIVAGLETHPVTSSVGVALLCRTQVTHVYIGQDQGRSGIPPPDRPLLSLSTLESSSAFRTLYRQDRVALFAFDRTVCA